MTCIHCSSPVDPDRAEFLRETRRPAVCMSCTGESPKLVFSEYGHKTAPSLVVVGTDPEAQRLALRAFKRAR